MNAAEWRAQLDEQRRLLLARDMAARVLVRLDDLADALHRVTRGEGGPADADRVRGALSLSSATLVVHADLDWEILLAHRGTAAPDGDGTT